MKTGILLVWVILCAGCGAGASSSTQNLPNDPNPYATEVASIGLNRATDRVVIMATVQAAELLAQQQMAYNTELLATVRAGEVPTPVERVAITDGGAITTDMLNLSSGEMEVQQIGVAGFVRPDDNCFETHQQYYDRAATNIIYMTAVISNAQEGTRFDVDWIFDNAVVYSTSWTVPENAARTCLAIPMRASDVVFNAGSWTARLFMNGVPLDNRPFEIVS